MFDIGFFEIMLIAVVGLLVLGPERLPEAVRTVGLWVGRIKRSLRDTRAELEQHLGTDEIRRQLHNEEIMRSLKNTRSEINRALNDPANLTAEVLDDIKSDKDRDSEHSEKQPPATAEPKPEKPALKNSEPQ